MWHSYNGAAIAQVYLQASEIGKALPTASHLRRGITPKRPTDKSVSALSTSSVKLTSVTSAAPSPVAHQCPERLAGHFDQHRLMPKGPRFPSKTLISCLHVPKGADVPDVHRRLPNCLRSHCRAVGHIADRLLHGKIGKIGRKETRLVAASASIPTRRMPPDDPFGSSYRVYRMVTDSSHSILDRRCGSVLAAKALATHILRAAHRRPSPWRFRPQRSDCRHRSTQSADQRALRVGTKSALGMISITEPSSISSVIRVIGDDSNDKPASNQPRQTLFIASPITIVQSNRTRAVASRMAIRSGLLAQRGFQTFVTMQVKTSATGGPARIGDDPVNCKPLQHPMRPPSPSMWLFGRGNRILAPAVTVFPPNG